VKKQKVYILVIDDKELGVEAEKHTCITKAIERAEIKASIYGHSVDGYTRKKNVWTYLDIEDKKAGSIYILEKELTVIDE